MTFLEALYGSQYEEVKRSGKEGNKGRLNGNLFLSAFLILFIVNIILLFVLIFRLITHDMGILISISFVNLGGNFIGKVVGLLLLGVILFHFN